MYIYIYIYIYPPTPLASSVWEQQPSPATNHHHQPPNKEPFTSCANPLALNHSFLDN